MKRFEKKTVLVTGGAAGIGRAIAERLFTEGANVVIADYNSAAGDSLAAELNAAGAEGETPRARSVCYDATDIPSAKALVDKAAEWFGTVDCLVNNVGGNDLKRDLDVAELDLDYFEEIFRLNLKSMLATTRAALVYMRKRGGSIVNVASIGGLMGDFRGSLYGMSKAGVVNLTRYVATQYGRDNVRCNCVAPWLVLTPAAEKNLSDDMRKVYLKYNTVPYLASAEDVAGPVAFLLSDDARYVSGQTMLVDGGMSCHNPTTADFM